MPGPGARRQKPRPKKPIQPPFVSLADNPISTFAIDIDHEEGWHIVVNLLCKHLEPPDMQRALPIFVRGWQADPNRERRPYNATRFEADSRGLYPNLRPDEHDVQQ
jgi:hypothetical protein